MCQRHTVFMQEWGRWGFLSLVTDTAFFTYLIMSHKISGNLSIFLRHNILNNVKSLDMEYV